MTAVLVSTKGRVVLPLSVRKALGLKPGMRVNIELEGRTARLTPSAARAPTATLQQVQDILRYDGPRVPVRDIRVSDCRHGAVAGVERAGKADRTPPPDPIARVPGLRVSRPAR